MNPIRTKPIKGLVIFLVIAFLLSTGMIVLFAIRSEEVMVMRVLVFIMCGIFAIGSLVVLFNQLFDYVEVRDDLIIHHVLFIKKKYLISKIDKVVNKEGLITVYVKHQKVITFTADTKEANMILAYLDRKGVKVGW